MLAAMSFDVGSRWMVIASVAVALSVAMRLISGWIERRERERTRKITGPIARARSGSKTES